MQCSVVLCDSVTTIVLCCLVCDIVQLQRWSSVVCRLSTEEFSHYAALTHCVGRGPPLLLSVGIVVTEDVIMMRSGIIIIIVFLVKPTKLSKLHSAKCVAGVPDLICVVFQIKIKHRIGDEVVVVVVLAVVVVVVGISIGDWGHLH